MCCLFSIFLGPGLMFSVKSHDLGCCFHLEVMAYFSFSVEYLFLVVETLLFLVEELLEDLPLVASMPTPVLVSLPHFLLQFFSLWVGSNMFI